MRAIPVGHDALLVECADLAEASSLHAEVLARGIEVTDLVPAARTVLLDGVRDPDALAREITGWRLMAGAAPDGELVELVTSYDGPDLEAVAEQWGTSVEDVVDLHTATEFTVAFCGFAPGFAYCTGWPDGRTVVRRESPRARIPAGSVGLAGPYTGVYPTGSPGGWQLIGRTDAAVWDVRRDPPALMPPGTRVRFVRG